MRIGMMADIYKTQVSGVTNYLTLSKRWLEKEGHEVYIFTFGDEDVVDDEKNIIRTMGIPLVDTGIYLNLRYDHQAVELLETMDITHVHHPFVSGSLAMRYCMPRNIPIVFTNHTRYDLLSHVYFPIIPDQISDAALKAYLTPFYQACDLIIIPSPSMREIMQEQFGVSAKIEVVPNGVDLEPFRHVFNPVDRSQFGFSAEDVVAIYLGRLSPEKNLPMLLQAFYGVASTYDKARLLIVGDGPERENLENMARSMDLGSNVFFTGMVDYKEVPAYFASADIFLNPSASETFGLSTVEAMATGLPVLGIDAPGSADIIEDGQTGLIAINDVAVFTAKLTLLTTNSILRKSMGQQATKASRKYDIETTTQTLLEYYHQLVDMAQQRKNDSLLSKSFFN